MTTDMVLRTIGISVPIDFPAVPYDAVHKVMESKRANDPLFEQYGGAWNAIGYRFRAAADYADSFVVSLEAHGAAPVPEERHQQEKMLFGFFSSGFSALESVFYGLYVMGAIVEPTHFPLGTPRDQQLVTPARTDTAFAKAFPGDSVLSTFKAVFADVGYLSIRETRNVLTHRAAPGRRMYVSIGTDDTLPTEWKLNNAPLDETIASKGRVDLSRLLNELLTASAAFAEAHIT